MRVYQPLGSSTGLFLCVRTRAARQGKAYLARQIATHRFRLFWPCRESLSRFPTRLENVTPKAKYSMPLGTLIADREYFLIDNTFRAYYRCFLLCRNIFFKAANSSTFCICLREKSRL
jgi:hypothetical protein